MYESYESSNMYFISYTNGEIVFGVDTLMVDEESNQQKIITKYFMVQCND